jgi:trans-aconitate methyltransferase
VCGYEADGRLVHAGRRRFGLDLRLADLDDLPAGEPAADLLLAINVLQRLEDPDRTLDWMAARRSAAGRVVVSVPPVVDEGTMAQHRGIASHRTHRFVWEWELRMRERFAQTTIYRHLPPAGADLRFGAPQPSRWTPGDFRFEQIAPAQLDAPGSLGVIFVGG